MSGRAINPKYLYPGILVVNIKIKKNPIPSSLIDLGSTINVMTKDIMLDLNLQSLIRPTTTVLQLVDTTTIRLEGILEAITINIKYWEYPRNFVVIEVKSKLSGYPLILGGHWLDTVDSYIGCRF